LRRSSSQSRSRQFETQSSRLYASMLRNVASVCGDRAAGPPVPVSASASQLSKATMLEPASRRPSSRASPYSGSSFLIE
jgi:hypothetical protein